MQDREKETRVYRQHRMQDLTSPSGRRSNVLSSGRLVSVISFFFPVVVPFPLSRPRSQQIISFASAGHRGREITLVQINCAKYGRSLPCVTLRCRSAMIPDRWKYANRMLLITEPLIPTSWTTFQPCTARNLLKLSTDLKSWTINFKLTANTFIATINFYLNNLPWLS